MFCRIHMLYKCLSWTIRLVFLLCMTGMVARRRQTWQRKSCTNSSKWSLPSRHQVIEWLLTRVSRDVFAFSRRHPAFAHGEDASASSSGHILASRFQPGTPLSSGLIINRGRFCGISKRLHTCVSLEFRLELFLAPQTPANRVSCVLFCHHGLGQQRNR